jgi:hypothetical protein
MSDKPTTTTTAKLGSVWVDTATLLIGDPCRFIPDAGDPDPTDDPILDYAEYMDLWDQQGTKVPFLDDNSRAFFSRQPPSDDRDGLLAATRTIEPAFVRIVAGDDPVEDSLTVGLAVRVGCDGWCPVYLETDEGGEPSRIIIELGGKVNP